MIKKTHLLGPILFLGVGLWGVTEEWSSSLEMQRIAPPKTGLLFTFGMDPRRYSFSKEQMQKGDYKLWLVSDPIDYYGQRLQKDSTFTHSFESFSSGSSTWGEVYWLSLWLEENPQETGPIVLVSHKWHLPRVQYCVNKLIFEHEKYPIYYYSLPDSLDSYNQKEIKKWTKQRGLVLEWVKYLGYQFVH